MPRPPSELGDLAFRVIEAVGPNAWLAIEADRPTNVGAALLAEIIALGGEDAAVTSLVSSFAELELNLRRHEQQVLIVTVSERFPEEEWAALDVNRSRLQRAGTAVLVLDAKSLASLENRAPNFASWIGGNVWGVQPAMDLDSASIEQRLLALRAWSGYSDKDVVKLAESGALPVDPQYAEWLALLGRGDLLVK